MTRNMWGIILATIFVLSNGLTFAITWDLKGNQYDSVIEAFLKGSARNQQVAQPVINYEPWTEDMENLLGETRRTAQTARDRYIEQTKDVNYILRNEWYQANAQLKTLERMKAQSKMPK